MKRFCLLVLCLVWTAALRADEPPTPPAARKAERVVVMIWDGLRADSVTDADTPTLARLAREGVTFTRHHPVYPSSTEVNGTAMATGCYPGHSGIIGNREYRPAIEPRKSVGTEDPVTVRRGDEVSGGKYLRVPTLPELCHAAGWRTAVAGTKSVALLWDRAARPDSGAGDSAALDSVTVYAGKSQPPGAAKRIGEAIGGPFPEILTFPNTDANDWTRRALVEALWKDGPPKFSVLWLSDPDYTQHQFGPSSPMARRALAACDANLAAVLAALDAGHWRDTTDVFVVSDHGFSTIKQPVDVSDRLKEAGFAATREFGEHPARGDVLVDGLGGTVFLYVAEHDPDTIRRLADSCQHSEWSGPIFTHDPLPGTFPISTLHDDSPDAPDVIVTMRWTDESNAAGLPGEIFADVDEHHSPDGKHPAPRRPGQGTHGTLSRYDMHNTLVAAGPDLRAGFRDELPSSNADLAPTIVRLLGLPHPPPMDGRVLAEALAAQDETGSGGGNRRTPGIYQRDRRRPLEPILASDPLRERNVLRRRERAERASRRAFPGNPLANWFDSRTPISLFSARSPHLFLGHEALLPARPPRFADHPASGPRTGTIRRRGQVPAYQREQTARRPVT